MACEVSSVLLLDTIIPSLPRNLIKAVLSWATRMPRIETLEVAVRHSRVSDAVLDVDA